MVHRTGNKLNLDVRVLLNNKEQIDIEIQVTSSEYWAERTLFYLGKMFVDQLKPGEDYQKLEKCIHIGILNFTLFDDEEYYSRFHFWSDQGMKEGRQEGRQEGIQAVVELLQEMGMEKEIVCVKIQERFQFSLSDAAKEVEKYWKS